MRTFALLTLSVVVLAVSACGESPAPPIAFSKAAIEDRIRRLRPDVETELRARLGAIELRITSAETLAELVARQMVIGRSKIEDGLRDEALKRQCQVEAVESAKTALGCVDPATGVLYICPDNFRAFRSQDGLDVVLIHELVHLWQVRHVGIDKFVGSPRYFDTLIARMSVLEGHAEFITHVVARKRGLVETVRLFDRLYSAPPTAGKAPRADPPPGSSAERFCYVDGLRFWNTITSELGREAAVERAFGSPPDSTFLISRPKAYLTSRTAPTFDLGYAAKDLERYFSELHGRSTRTRPASVPDVRAAFLPGGSAAVEAANKVAGGRTLTCGRARVSLLLCENVGVAARLLAASKEVHRSRLTQAERSIGEPRSTNLTIESCRAVHTEATALVSGASVRVDQFTIIDREMYVEVVLYDVGFERSVRAARRILQLTRGGWTSPARRELDEDSLGHADWGTRWRAVRALAPQLATRPELRNRLRSALKDKHPSVRIAALNALGPVDAAALAVDRDWEVRREFCRALARDETLEWLHRVERVTPFLDDSHDEVRLCSATELRELEAVGEIPAVTIRALLKSENTRLRRAAVQLVPGNDGYAGSVEFGRMLIDLLDDADTTVREHAADRIGAYKTLAHSSVRKLRGMLNNGPPRVASAATDALGELGQLANDAVPELTKLLGDKVLGASAAEALAKIGESAIRAARDELIALLDSGDELNRLGAARALWKLKYDPVRMARIAREAMANGWWTARVDAIDLLGELQAHAHRHIPALTRALVDRNEWVREHAARALGSMGSAAREALPELRQLCHDENRIVRRRAREAIDAINRG